VEEVQVDVVVLGRHCEVTERFRRHVEDKMTRLEKFASRVHRVDVVVSKENTRDASQSERVELTVVMRGPVVRAEAAAVNRYVALDLALDKLLTRLRKAIDRRRVHRGARAPMSVAEATSGPLKNATAPVEALRGGAEGTETEETAKGAASTVAGMEVVGEGPLVVREKTHVAAPMTLDQALYEMELVGHDFYLFVDADTHQPSVVYRRKGYDYGVIRLESQTQPAAASGGGR
jgi:ribosomal subunit interface protein